MTALAILALTIVISIVVVKIGTVALRMTGMEENSASFQALSAFTGTGFTTREAEKVVRHAMRRRVVRVLMILGNAGLATVIASAIATFSGGGGTSTLLVKAAALVVFAVVLYRVGAARRVNSWLSAYIEHRLEEHTDLDLIDFEEILSLDHGRGIATVELHAGNPVAGKAVGDLGLAAAGVLVLAIERKGVLLAAVGAATRVEAEDRLFVYGDTVAMKALANGEYIPERPQHAALQELFALDEAYRVIAIEARDERLVGHTLRSLKLPAQGIVVLAVRRGDRLMPTPAPDDTIEHDDQLICYGPLQQLEHYAADTDSAPTDDGAVDD